MMLLDKLLEIPTPLPCPCCGAVVSLEVGSLSATTHGVRCGACGLTMERGIIDLVEVVGEKTADNARHQTLLHAVQAWNQRDK